MENVTFWSNALFNGALLLYFHSTIFYVYSFIRSKEKTGAVATYLAIIGLVIHAAALIVRSLELARAPLQGRFDFASAFVWAVVFSYIILEWRYKHTYRVFGAFVMPLATLLMIYAFFLDRGIRPLMPALRSHWLVVHASTSTFAYGGFLIAFALAIMYLYRAYREQKGPLSNLVSKFPALEVLDDFIYKAVAFGLIFQTLLIVTGAIWAEQAWGRYWGWDPKETWSLITWIIYAVILHTRFTRGWTGKPTAWLAILGFFCVLFTWIGVSVLLPGLHSWY